MVVIAIIASLVGLSVPILRSSRERARTAVCAGRIKQLLVGLWSYQTENGTFPYGFQKASGQTASRDHYAGIAGSVDLAGWWWFDYSQEVNHATGDGLGVLSCPSKRQSDALLAVNLLCGNYGANLSVCRVEQYTQPYRDGFYGEPLSFNQIPQPAETLLLVDSGYSLISWWHATESPPVQLPPASMMLGGIQHAAYVPGMGINKDRTLLQGQTDDARGGRHPHKTVNVGFTDAHVATRKADEMLVEKTADSHWDNSPLWQPKPDPVKAASP